MSSPDPEPHPAKKISKIQIILIAVGFLFAVSIVLVGIPLLLLGRGAKPLIMIFLGMLAVGTVVMIPKLLIDHTWETKHQGKVSTVVQIMYAICLIAALPVAIYVLLTGAINLWHESEIIAALWAGAVAFVAYYHLSRPKSSATH
jgi:hypothetical protein